MSVLNAAGVTWIWGECYPSPPTFLVLQGDPTSGRHWQKSRLGGRRGTQAGPSPARLQLLPEAVLPALLDVLGSRTLITLSPLPLQ